MRSIELGEVWDARPADRGFMTALATLALLALGLELVVAGTVLTITGDLTEYYPLVLQVVLWIGLGLAWLGAARLLVAWSRRRGVDPLPPSSSAALGHRIWSWMFVCFVCALLAAVVLPLVDPGPWSVAPVRVYLDLYGLHGPLAWLPTLAWLVHDVGQSVLLASFLAYAHRAVRMGLDSPVARRIPWGGLLAGAVHGAITYLSTEPAVALAVLVSWILLGVIHVLSGESLRITAVFAALVLVLL